MNSEQTSGTVAGPRSEPRNPFARTGRRQIIIEGHVHTSGDVLYVNGMKLASIVHAAIPEDELPDGDHRDYGYLAITVERRRS